MSETDEHIWKYMLFLKKNWTCRNVDLNSWVCSTTHVRWNRFQPHSHSYYWLVVWNMNFMTFHILGISPSQLTNSDLFRGIETTNQIRNTFNPIHIPIKSSWNRRCPHFCWVDVPQKVQSWPLKFERSSASGTLGPFQSQVRLHEVQRQGARRRALGIPSGYVKIAIENCHL